MKRILYCLFFLLCIGFAPASWAQTLFVVEKNSTTQLNYNCRQWSGSPNIQSKTVATVGPTNFDGSKVTFDYTPEKDFVGIDTLTYSDQYLGTTTSGEIYILTLNHNKLSVYPGQKLTHVLPIAPGISYQWYNQRTGGSTLDNTFSIKNDGSLMLTPAITSPTTYYIQALHNSTSIGKRFKIKVIVNANSDNHSASNPLLQATGISPFASEGITLTAPEEICEGEIIEITQEGAEEASEDHSGPRTKYMWQKSKSEITWESVSEGIVGDLSDDPPFSVNTTNNPYIYYRLLIYDDDLIEFATISNHLKLTIIPFPIVTITATTTELCEGENVNLTAGGADSYTWSPATGLSTTTGDNVTANPTETTTYTITGTNGNRCSSSETVTITVKPLPVLTLTPNSAICAGGSADLIAGGADTYTWSPATGLSATTGDNVIANPTETTTYTVIGTNTATGCTSTKTVTITVNPLPELTLTPNSAICAGASVDLTAGGTDTYTWSPATGLSTTTGDNVTANPTGTTIYTITGTNVATGCISEKTVTVTVNPLPVLTQPANQTLCSGESTVAISFAGTDVDPSACTWTNSNTAIGLAAGGTGTIPAFTAVNTGPSPITATIIVTPKSADGCESTVETFTITVNPKPELSLTPNSAICAGGSIILTAGGADTYTWSPATGLSATTGTTVMASPASTTIYTVTGTSAATGCISEETVTVTVNPLPVLTQPANQTLCSGENTVAISFAGTDVDPSACTWTNSNTAIGLAASGTGTIPVFTAVNTGLSPVTATITVTPKSADGCESAVKTFTITVNPKPILTLTPNSTICAGGSVDLTVGGADTYIWSPATGLSATTGNSVTSNLTETMTYTVTGTSVTGCISTEAVTVTVDPLPVLSLTPSSAICYGESITLAAGGADTYTWSPATGLSTTTGTTVTANPTSTTTYTLTGTSATGCISTKAVTVTVNPLPVLTQPANQTLCSGESTVAVSFAGTDVDPSACTWTNSNTAIGLAASGTGTVPAFTAVNTGPSPVTATITVTPKSADGCESAVKTFTITVNPKQELSLTPNSTICAGASVVLTAGGADTYTWSPATGLSSTTGATVTASPTSTTTYSVTGTSATGCISTEAVTVTVNPLPGLTQPANQTLCSGESTVAVSFAGTDVDPSACTWTNSNTAIGLAASGTGTIPAFTAVNTGPSPVTATITVTPKSADGCESTVKTFTITVNPKQELSLTPNSTICAGASVVLTAGGADTYTWSPATGLSTTTGTTITANPTLTTTYTVTGTYTTGCTSTKTVTITVNPLPALTLTPNSAVCAGESVALTAGGAATYTWSPATGLFGTTGATVTASPTATTTYTVTGTDLSGCTSTKTVTVTVNPSPVLTLTPNSTVCFGASMDLTAGGAATYTWSPAAGLSGTTGATVTAGPTATTTYTVTGTDLNGCTSAKTVTVTVNPLPVLTLTPNSAICTGASVVLTVGGANTYEWSPAAGLSGTTGATVTASPTATTTYTVTGTDLNGCTSAKTVTVTVNPLPMLTLTPNSTICTGASVDLTAEGADTYEWSPTVGLSGTAGATITASPTSTTTYTVIGTDQNGCSSTDSKTITVNLLPNVQITASNAELCKGESVNLTAEGASNYTWAAGLGSTASLTQTPVTSTTYIVTGTDGNGCKNTASHLVTVNNPPTVNITGPTTICEGEIISLQASGDGALYSWSTGHQTAYLYVRADQTTVYELTATSASCSTVVSHQVVVHAAPKISILGEQAVCKGTPIQLIASGTDLLEYEWQLGALGNQQGPAVNFTPDQSGTYWVKATTKSGCTGQQEHFVQVHQPEQISILSDTVACEGQAIELIVSGAESYEWNTGTTGNSLNVYPDKGTTFHVKGIDINGCQTERSITVQTHPRPQAKIIASLSKINQKHREVEFTAAGTGAMYFWELGDGQSSSEKQFVYSYNAEEIGQEYRVSLQEVNEHGCIDTAYYDIKVSFYIPNTFTPNGDGINDFFMDRCSSCKNIQVFDRLGVKVYEGTNGWDGKYNGRLLGNDTYFYIINYVDQVEEVLKGYITLLRR